MYVLTILNDWEDKYDYDAQYEIKVFSDGTDIPKIIAQITKKVMNAIHGACGQQSDELCAKYVDQTLEGRYPEYEHQLTDTCIEDLYADYFSKIRRAPERIRASLASWVVSEAHGLIPLTMVNEVIYRECYDDVSSMLFRALISWYITNDGIVGYEVLFDKLPDKDATAGERIHVRLEHKDSYDTLD